MTDQELKDLVASNAIEIAEIAKRFRETDEKFRETDEKFRETDEKFRETTDRFRETDEKWKKSEERWNKTDEKWNKTDTYLLEAKKFLKETGKQIGGLGNSIGNITEGIAYPSISKELRKKFKVDFVDQNVSRTKKNENFEVDVLAFSNSTSNEVYIVEIKTVLNKDSIKQILDSLSKFREFFPEHKDKKLYGIICALKAKKEDIKAIYENGLFFAEVKDGFFRIHKPENFHPKEF